MDPDLFRNQYGRRITGNSGCSPVTMKTGDLLSDRIDPRKRMRNESENAIIREKSHSVERPIETAAVTVKVESGLHDGELDRVGAHSSLSAINQFASALTVLLAWPARALGAAPLSLRLSLASLLPASTVPAIHRMR
jgi:hypothetical protein